MPTLSFKYGFFKFVQSFWKSLSLRLIPLNMNNDNLKGPENRYRFTLCGYVGSKGLTRWSFGCSICSI